MTTTEQIVWAHRVDKDHARAAEAGHDAARLRRPAAGVGRHRAVRDPHVQPDHRRQHDLSAAGGDCQRSLRLHRRRRRRQADRASAASSRGSTASRQPYYATPGDGIFHFYFPEQGLVMPGQFIPGADSHSRAYGAYGAVGIGVGSTTLGFGWSTGYIYFTLARQRRVRFEGRLQPWVSGKDIVLELLRRVGREAVAGDVGGARRRRRAAADGVSQHDREHDGRGRSAERHLRARRDHLRLVSAKGHHRRCRIRRSRPGADARLRDRRGARPLRRCGR